MSAAFSKPSKVSFLIPASLFVFKSVTTNDIIFGCTSCTSSGIGSILFPWKYFSYFSLNFEKSFGLGFIFFVHEAGSEGTLCAGCIELADEDGCESAGHLSSGFEGGL